MGEWAVEERDTPMPRDRRYDPGQRHGVRAASSHQGARLAGAGGDPVSPRLYQLCPIIDFCYLFSNFLIFQASTACSEFGDVAWLLVFGF